jgi:hypothetical protein
MTELKDLLERAGDDDGRPLLTDFEELLDRAQHGRAKSRVHRAVAALGAAGILGALVGGVALNQHSGGREAGPAGPSASSSPQRPRLAPVSHAEVIDRCGPQLAAYSRLPMYTQHPEQASWTLLPGHYRVDQVVLLDPGDGGNPEFCRIPAQGEVHFRVPLASYTGSASDIDLLTQNCQQTASYSGSSFTLDDPRSGGITAAATVDHVSAAVLVTRDGQAALCSMSPVTWDAGITDVQRFDRGIALAFGTTGGANKSIVDQTASWYLLGGVLSRRAAAVELSVSGGPSRTFPVNDGYAAGVLRDARPGGLRSVSWRVLDDRGNVLRSGHEE